jgi:hypothetical protein
MGTEEKRQAAEMLLDIGIRIPVIPKRLFGRKGGSRLVMRRPPGGCLLRIALRYLKIGVTPQTVEDMSYDERMKFIAENGKAVSEMVALSICTGYISGILFVKPVAWYLRWRVHPAMLTEAMIHLLKGIDIKSFCSIIPLASKVESILNPIGSQNQGMS